MMTREITNRTIAFAGAVIGAWAWSMTGGETFPREADPTGDPETWTREELRRWLSAVSSFIWGR